MIKICKESLLLKLQAPNLAKVWYEFASWSLEMGEKVLASAVNGRVALTIQEEFRLKTSVNDLEQLNDLTDLLSQVHLKQIQTEIEVDKTEFMRKTLLTFRLQRNVPLSAAHMFKFASKNYHFEKQWGGRKPFGGQECMPDHVL